MTSHAMLSASGAERWLNCTPSAGWEQRFPDAPASDAADEGTLAHVIAEERLRQLLAGEKPTTSANLRDHRLYHPAMNEHVDTYVGYVWEQLVQARKTTPDALLLLEQRLDFSEYVPGGFGTGDAILIADGLMQVFDLKFGKGVPVDATDNPQIRLYGLGALNEFADLYDIDAVALHIVQPRLDSITCETLRVTTLREWGETYVKPRAALAANGEGEMVAGAHCRWCRCRHVCRAYGRRRVEIAAEVRFGTPLENWQPDLTERLPDMLSIEEIARVLAEVDDLVRWAKSIKDYALDQAVNHGARVPGWKVVEGRANRVITDEKQAAELLRKQGYGTDDIMTLRGIGALEDLVGKKALTTLLANLIVKPAGKPTLAPETDTRPAISSAENAKRVFEEV